MPLCSPRLCGRWTLSPACPACPGCPTCPASPLPSASPTRGDVADGEHGALLAGAKRLPLVHGAASAQQHSLANGDRQAPAAARTMDHERGTPSGASTLVREDDVEDDFEVGGVEVRRHARPRRVVHVDGRVGGPQRTPGCGRGRVAQLGIDGQALEDRPGCGVFGACASAARSTPRGFSCQRCENFRANSACDAHAMHRRGVQRRGDRDRRLPRFSPVPPAWSGAVGSQHADRRTDAVRKPRTTLPVGTAPGSDVVRKYRDSGVLPPGSQPFGQRREPTGSQPPLGLARSKRVDQHLHGLLSHTSRRLPVPSVLTSDL